MAKVVIVLCWIGMIALPLVYHIAISNIEVTNEV